ncbi:MAG: hypothetical protein A2898_05790 [Candidatus Kerfeldbacteria bacterium RIFCSPLOWO2_01_FULL_48_11]|uniref:Transposase IS200-like domain-containing protein n=1 Tax=Candidatus Kerfeldbacteria bacterium RIFCSPLOWO2_01_FULL_48_11 TaxID=1798543 RepID=A0A1G2B384_9BACT|nr:MAG: hypothetical protein UY34_C0007G0007 [Parcubacteria group bacterium GW2011_GWA2_48_9]KKW15186.1 MAG: hypothetical protein UY52_C0020G0006 [Parcubacteria group bacterium GW2011_GWC2_49_9]OGY83663.1 MAG: hypothetical protein A2898_05790 [Candidatus Kerfeldbacteria bacterium RIFCSPLOWO2_01_FULL_48_11]HCM67960.1 hypothetical protein [Candidatus Kerfeldbacteria bacterium]
MTQRRIYLDQYPYFVTFRTRVDLKIFEDGEYAEMLSRIIFNAGRLKRFNILAYQIMPDHVHVLTCQQTPIIGAGDIHIPRARASASAIGKVYPIAPRDGCARGKNVSELIHGIKSYFATEIRQKFGINYSVLQPRFYSRTVNTDAYLYTVVEYIRFNPIKARLPKKYHHMPYQLMDTKLIKLLFY